MSFVRSNTEVEDLNPTQGMDVCFYSVFVLSCVGNGLAATLAPAQGVLLTVYVIKKL
jgi:hypothetical protein